MHEASVVEEDLPLLLSMWNLAASGASAATRRTADVTTIGVSVLVVSRTQQQASADAGASSGVLPRIWSVIAHCIAVLVLFMHGA